MLFQPLKIRNQIFSNTLCVSLESRAFNANGNYNSNPLCVNILPEESNETKCKWGDFPTVKGFGHFPFLSAWSTQPKAACIFLSSVSYLSWMQLLVFFFFFPFHFQCVIQFWELLKNSLGIVKSLGAGPDFPELICSLPGFLLHMTAVDISRVPCPTHY